MATELIGECLINWDFLEFAVSHRTVLVAWKGY